MIRLLLLPVLLLLGACSWFHTTPPIEKVVVTQKLIYPHLPNINAPPLSKIEPIEFDWPRLSNYYSIKNSKKCEIEFLKLFPGENPRSFRLKIDESSGKELEQHGEFWYDCSIASIDRDSNLYIGMNEVEYKKLVNNTKSMMMREKQWRALLVQINDMIDGWREQKNDSAAGKEAK